MESQPIYKTAADLGIEPWEHAGLVALIGPLSRDELKVSMDTTDQDCGTVACIGGWLAIRHGISWSGGNVYRYVCEDRSKALTHLFFPFGGALGATAPQAARAIINFLMTGDPKWSAVMDEASEGAVRL